MKPHVNYPFVKQGQGKMALDEKKKIAPRKTGLKTAVASVG